jgi:hypothetical protein
MEEGYERRFLSVGATGLEPVTPSVSKGLSLRQKSQETLVGRGVYVRPETVARAVVRLPVVARKRGISAENEDVLGVARKMRGRTAEAGPVGLLHAIEARRLAG